MLSEEEIASQELRGMSLDQLEKVDHVVLKWQCSLKGCDHFTRIKDFGIAAME